MLTVNVTELKNHLSANLERVQAGDSVLVLDRRRPVAIIEPVRLGAVSGAVGGLIAAGIVQAPEAAVEVEGFLRLPKGRGASLQAVILEERESR